MAPQSTFMISPDAPISMVCLDGTPGATSAHDPSWGEIVPSSNQRMLNKSRDVDADTLIYDLEDSVAPDTKDAARKGLVQFLQNPDKTLPPSKVSVRINDHRSQWFQDDVEALMSLPPGLASTIVVPKVEDLEPLERIRNAAAKVNESAGGGRGQRWNMVASIESAKALCGIEKIAAFESSDAACLVALLFASEDYCASTSIIRSRSRVELLYARSKIVNVAKAHDLHAIDMVNIHYEDDNYHIEECEEGRALGFVGKQAIHPRQVARINEAYRPTNLEIYRAAKILYEMSLSHKEGAGAFGLAMRIGGRKEMIDAPMVKQAENIVRFAQLCGIRIPDVSKEKRPDDWR